jgi:hypothetical protein
MILGLFGEIKSFIWVICYLVFNVVGFFSLVLFYWLSILNFVFLHFLTASAHKKEGRNLVDKTFNFNRRHSLFSHRLWIISAEHNLLLKAKSQYV